MKRALSISMLTSGAIFIVAAGVLASTIKSEILPYQYSSFQKAHQADSFIRFTMVHRKFGMMPESFDGVVKHFTVLGELSGQEFQHPEVKFNVLDMDTNNNMRNGKMQSESLSARKYPNITVHFGRNLKLGSQTVPGTINILGSPKPIELPITIQDQGTSYKATGKTSVLLSALGIPKPNFISDAIASVDDKVNITYQLLIPKEHL